MAFSLSFKNLGHYFATGAKYIAIGIADVVKFVAKAEKIAPEVDALIGAIAGPAAAKISDLAFHVLGDVAAQIDKLSLDSQTLATQGPVNLTFDAQVVNDVKAVAKEIEQILKAVGAQKPV